MDIKNSLKNEKDLLTKDTNKTFNLSVIFATIILFIYCYFGSFSFFEKTFTNCPNSDYYKIIYHNFMPFVLFFLLGLLYTKFVIKKSPKDFGLNLRNKKFTFTILIIACGVIPLIALSTLLDNQMIATYPLVNFDACSWWQILLYFLSYLTYYIGWEYLFRGILFFGTKEKLGALSTILLTTLISALIHTSIAGFGKPMIETLSAIPAGLIFGYFAYKSDNIFTSLGCHVLVGFLTDLFIFLII